MYTIQKAKQQVLSELKKAGPKGFSPSMEELETPPDSLLGDLAYPCFELSKKLKRNPNEIATEIAAKIGPKEYIASVKAVGPYVNVFLDEKGFGGAVLEEIKKRGEEYGHSKVGNEKRVMVEFANLNTHKDIHIGHLRNLFVGQTVVNLLNASGYDVIPVAYINDLGTHVAQSIWAMQTFHKGEELPEGEQRIHFLRDVYVEGNNAIKEDETLKTQVSQIFQTLEGQKKSDDLTLWKTTRKWSIDYLTKVYDELELSLDHWYFESEVIVKTKKMIDKLIKDGLVVQSEGAWIVDLQDVDLGVNLLIKSDGTLLYNAKDLVLAHKKEDDYHPARSVYVVDERQSHALRQLFETLRRMGFKREMEHLSYEFVTLSDGAMGSRKGNVIRYETVRDQLLESARVQTQNRHEDWKEKQIEATTKAIAFGAMRFGMLKQDIAKKIVFDFDEVLSFEGYTGPYLLYTYARIQSLLAKAGKTKPVYGAATLKEAHSHALLVTLARYPEVIFQATGKMQPSILAQYLFDLAKQFSEFYANVPVLTAKDETLGERLALITSVAQVLKGGLGILGMHTIDEM
jgi:arginyl-tRNA synthetase